MEERRNLNQDDVLDLMGNFPLQPMFNGIYITTNRIEEDTLDLSNSILSEVQYVVAAGDTAQVKVGQKILIDIEKLSVNVRQESINTYEDVKEVKLDLIETNDNIFALVTDRVIKAKDNR